MNNISDLVVPKMIDMAKYLGIGLIVLGLIAVFAPTVTGMTIGVIIGILLVVSGLLRIAFAWVAMTWGDAILRFLFGLLALVAGIVMITDPALGLRVITIAAIIYLVVDGISNIVFAIRLPPATGSGWIVLSGVLSIVLGGLIWFEWPFAGDKAVGILVGVKLIFDGIAMLAVAMTVSSVGKSLR